MRIRTSILCLVAAAAALPARPQDQPYAAEANREIKALSTEEIESYRAGAGMGFGKAAELNHYPGPKHALALARELRLHPRQKEETQAIYDRMHAETVKLGERLVTEERLLDRMFAEAAVEESALARKTREIARLQGEIRLSHLKAHLEMRAMLTPAQIAKYDELRGYGKNDPTVHDPARHGH